MDAKNAMHILQNLAHNTACENVHHKKDQQHAFRLPCPVVEEIQQAAGIVSKRIKELEKVAENAVIVCNLTEDSSMIHQLLERPLRAAGYGGGE